MKQIEREGYKYLGMVQDDQIRHKLLTYLKRDEGEGGSRICLEGKETS